MVNNSSNIIKTNNHLSPQLIEHEKKTMTSDIGNPGPGMGDAKHFACLSADLFW